jgi:hypothetical protein
MAGSRMRAGRRHSLPRASIGPADERGHGLVGWTDTMLAMCVRRARRVVRGGRSGRVLGRRRQRDGCGSAFE